MQLPTGARWGLLLCLVTAPAFAQAPPPAPPPPTLGRPVPIPPLSQPTPLAWTPPPPPAVLPPPGTCVPLDPGPAGWGPFECGSAPPGFFVAADVAVVFPALKYRITNDAPLPNTGLKLNVPSTPLDTTVTPTFELGYRLPDSAGLFALSYSFLFADGNGQATNALGTFDVHTKAQVNWINLDYGTTPCEFAPRWDVSWRIGARIADVYFDSRATNPTLIQFASNDFFGAGPHARMDLERRIVPVPGLALFGRVDGAVLVGRIRQTYQAEKGGTMDAVTVRRNQTVPYINLQGGLSYAPPALPGLKLTTGYLLENYFNAGRLGEDSTGMVSESRGELWWHGVFVRAQFDF